jgi:hypothetical protein
MCITVLFQSTNSAIEQIEVFHPPLSSLINRTTTPVEFISVRIWLWGHVVGPSLCLLPKTTNVTSMDYDLRASFSHE